VDDVAKAEPQDAEGAGPFTTRMVWRRSDGGTATWESRTARKRGVLGVRSTLGDAERREAPDAAIMRRLGRINVLAAVAFTIGGSLFVVGAAVAQLGSGNAATSASIYLAGGVFFSTGGYASLLGAINAPRPVTGGHLAAPEWRWWSYEPMRLDWLSTFVLFAGTLVFAISLGDSFLQGLSTKQVNRLIWAPDIVGCILFLISGHLALVEISHGRRRWRPQRNLGWWIVAINQLGSILFFISGLAALTRPSTGSLANIDIANWGTLTGALCFAIGGVMQAFERPRR
jgi:hypothetical protein